MHTARARIQKENEKQFPAEERNKKRGIIWSKCNVSVFDEA